MAEKNNISNVAIFNHHQGGTTDATQPLLDYLLSQGVRRLVNVRFPFLTSTTGEIQTRIFEGSKIKTESSLIKFYRPMILSYIKDTLYSLLYGLKYCKGTDIYFGTPNILVLSGIFLRRLGFVKKVIYYTIDYTPMKFEYPLVNKIYFLVDRFVCYHADEVWSLNEAMIESRIADRGWNKAKINIRIVPFGNNGDRFSSKDYLGNSKDTIVYFGGISQDKGAELFVPIAQNLIKLSKKDFKFLVIGGGKVQWLKSEVKKAKLSKYFEITGPIESHHQIENRLIKCGVAIAPYYPENINNFSYYSDPGKIKTYLGSGLPVVITNVPPISKEIESMKVGLIADYDPKDFAQKIIGVLSTKKYVNYRKQAILFGKCFNWMTIFNNAFGESNIR